MVKGTLVNDLLHVFIFQPLTKCIILNNYIDLSSVYLCFWFIHLNVKTLLNWECVWAGEDAENGTGKYTVFSTVLLIFLVIWIGGRSTVAYFNIMLNILHLLHILFCMDQISHNKSVLKEHEHNIFLFKSYLTK